MIANAIRVLCFAGVVGLCSPAAAQVVPPELDPRTAQTDLPLEGSRAAMKLDHVLLSIAVDPDAKAIAGEARHRVRATARLERLEFDLDPRFDVLGVSLHYGGPNAWVLGSEDWTSTKGRLRIRLPEPLASRETVEVTIQWQGQPHVALNAPWDGGFTWAQAPGGQPWIATTVQGEGCDIFWPCIDHSSSRIGSIDMAVTVPNGLVAAGNGVLIDTVDNANGTTTFRWRARNPSNYGISLQIGPYALAERSYASRFGHAIPLKFWHLPGHAEEAQRLLGELASQMAFFEEKIGPYPFSDEKAGVVETPHLGMEHQTINAYGNGFRRDPLGYDWLLAHEFAHEWFANQLSHTDIRHMWLHEGIGTWMQPLYLEWARGEMYYNAEMWTSRKLIFSRVPLVPLTGEVFDYNDREIGWGTDIYYKGAWVMHTMRYLLGEEAVLRGLTRLTYGTDTPVPGQIAPVLRTTDDFRAILEAMTGEELDWFFDAYFYHAELPRLETVRSGDRLSLTWHSGSDLPFAMPVEMRVNGEVQRVPMPDGRAEIVLPSADSHVLLDPRNQILKFDEAIEAMRRAN